MRKFLFTSPQFAGQITLGYNEECVLVLFENEADLSPLQLDYFTCNFPFRLANLEHVKGKSGIITEVTDISFDKFWNDYNVKKSKIQAQREWGKLSDGERTKAIMAIPRYRRGCKNKSIEMVYPERYLKYRRYDDE